MLTSATLLGLFFAAFLAATPVPFQSEVVFLALLAGKTFGTFVLILVASVGNTLGSCVTYAAGRGLGGERASRWFHLPANQIARAEGWFAKWGLWSLLFSWAPGGDLLVALSGMLRVPLWQFVVLVGFAKTIRYCVVAMIGLGIWG